MADAFADYVVARQRALLRSAWLLTGDWALAEDLVQTALIKVWPRFDRVPDTVLVSWTEWRTPANGTSQIWAALTRDAGATWKSTPLHDPALPPMSGRMELRGNSPAG